jgi:hypothetical protein
VSSGITSKIFVSTSWMSEAKLSALPNVLPTPPGKTGAA